MELTKHGYERILGRTKMLIKDVLCLISSGAVVNLGSITGREYLLFYSPPDGCCKIAVVAARRTQLISILEYHYSLPEGLIKVNRELMHRAQNVLYNLLIEEIKKNFSRVELGSQQDSKSTQSVSNPKILLKHKCYDAKIEIQFDGIVQYTHNLGMILQKEAKTPVAVLFYFQPQVKPIIDIVESEGYHEQGQVLYTFGLTSSSSQKLVKKYSLRHETIKKYLKTKTV